MTRLSYLLLTLAILYTGLPVEAAAQTLSRARQGMTISPLDAKHGLSVNPIGWTFDFYNVEYEGKISDGATAGAGASVRTWPDGTRLNGDVFLRYYLGGQAFHGIALGLKVGPTRQSTGATHLGVGFDINQTLPVKDLVFISTGFGVKRLIGAKVDPGWSTDDRRVFTARFNIGFRF